MERELRKSWRERKRERVNEEDDGRASLPSLKLMSAAGLRASGILHPLNHDSFRAGGAPREQKMLKGHLPRVIYHPVDWWTKRVSPLFEASVGCGAARVR